MDSDDEFESWLDRWMDLASYSGPLVPDQAARIERLTRLWSDRIPGTWDRTMAAVPPRLRRGRPRYSRGDAASPRSGEHTIEHEILCGRFAQLKMLGCRVIDGVNAFPLVRDAEGRRATNVEADLLLFYQSDAGTRGAICEVKRDANHAWYAVVQNLLQVKLARESKWVIEYCEDRIGAFTPLLTGVIVAPPSFYTATGGKLKAVHAACALLEAMATNGEPPPVQLATWNADKAALESIPSLG